VRRTTVRTPRGRFAAFEAMPATGVCERDPALLVPGFTGSKEDFLPILRQLGAAGRRVVAIDMRGQYETPGTGDRDAYSLPELGAVLQAVLEPLRGLAGAQLAAEVRRLWDLQLSVQARADGVPPKILDFLGRRMLRSHPDGLVAVAEQLLDCPDKTSALAAVARLPILVLYGEYDDKWQTPVQEDMAGRLGAERVCIPGATHSPAVEAPETTASALNAFWNAAEAISR
jgi:pimeloyl-ACP methyl ester carboxylesterase